MKNQQNNALMDKINKLKKSEESSKDVKDKDIPEVEEGIAPNSEEGELRIIPLSKIMANPYQPRKTFRNIEELAENIKDKGLIQAIAVTKRDNDYIIIAGERRFRACSLLSKNEDKKVAEKFNKIKAVIFNNITNKDLKELAIIENVQREDMTMFEYADGFKTLQQDGYSIRDIEVTTGVSRSKVQRFLKIADLHQSVRAIIESHDIQPGIAILLAEAEISDSQRLQLLEKESLRHNKAKLEKALAKMLTIQDEQESKKDIFDEARDLFSKASTPIKKREYMNLNGEKREKADKLLQQIIDSKNELAKLIG